MFGIYMRVHHQAEEVRPISSEGTGANHRHHNDVSNSGQDGDPQPNSVTGHFPILLGFWRSWAASIEIGGGCLQGRVAIVRRIHEGSAHSREVLQKRRINSMY